MYVCMYVYIYIYIYIYIIYLYIYIYAKQCALPVTTMAMLEIMFVGT